MAAKIAQYHAMFLGFFRN